MIKDWSNKKVLVAEDEQVNYLFLKAVLKPTNIDVLWAKNGLETMDQFKNNPDIDIVLMDLKMPLLNGLEATRKIKEEKPFLPIIAQTAYAHDEDELAAMEAGCDAFISKPIRPDSLLTIMAEYLD